MSITAIRACYRQGSEDQVLWLAWSGPAPAPADLPVLVGSYWRRFDVEHLLRLAKGTLG